MRENSAESIRRVLISEGGYVNHPSDPGGPTNFGITLADYRRYAKPGATAGDVRAMNKAEAVAIYDSKYWDAQKLDSVIGGVDYAVLDYGVNSGIGRSQKVLQRVLGLPVTGKITVTEIEALSKRDPKAVVHAICDERRQFLRHLKIYPTFGAGWERRVNEVEQFGYHLITRPPSAIGAQKPPVTEAQGKAEVTRPTIINPKSAGGGLVGGGGAAWSMWDVISAHPWETAGVVVVGGVVVSCGVHYAMTHWHRNKQETPMPGTIVVPALA